MSRPLSPVLHDLVYSCPAGTTLVTMSPVSHTVLKILIIILPYFLQFSSDSGQIPYTRRTQTLWRCVTTRINEWRTAASEQTAASTVRFGWHSASEIFTWCCWTWANFVKIGSAKAAGYEFILFRTRWGWLVTFRLRPLLRRDKLLTLIGLEAPSLVRVAGHTMASLYAGK